MSADMGWAAVAASCLVLGSGVASGDALATGIALSAATVSYIYLAMLSRAEIRSRADEVARVIAGLDGPNYGEKTFIGVPGSFMKANGTAWATEVDRLADGNCAFRIDKKLEDIAPKELAEIVQSNTLAFANRDYYCNQNLEKTNA